MVDYAPPATDKLGNQVFPALDEVTVIDKPVFDGIIQGLIDSVQTNPDTAKNDIQPEADVVALILRAYAAGSSDILQVFNDAGLLKFKIDDEGRVVIGGTPGAGPNTAVEIWPENQLFIVGGEASAAAEITRSVSMFSTKSASPWSGWVGTNLYHDGVNFVKGSDDGTANWGNTAGIWFHGAALGDDIATRFVNDTPNTAGGGVDEPIGTGFAAAFDSRTSGLITSNGRWSIGGSGAKPRAVAHVHGSFAHKVVTKSSNYTLNVTETVCLADTGSGSITITLPDANLTGDRLYRIKKKSTDINTLTIATTGADTIDGNSTVSLVTPYASVDVVSDGANWFIL